MASSFLACANDAPFSHRPGFTCVQVGIDISRNRHEVGIAVPGKASRRRMTVLNAADDYRRLINVPTGFELPVTIVFRDGSVRRALSRIGKPCRGRSFRLIFKSFIWITPLSLVAYREGEGHISVEIRPLSGGCSLWKPTS